MTMSSITPDMALDRLQKWCAVEDRCHADARKKLYEWHIYGDDQENILADLILDGFLNEERFARSYARGKFRIKRWGRIKIVQHLKQKQISEYCIRAALEEIADEDYTETLRSVLVKKKEITTADTPFLLRQKIYRYALQKGYESQEIISLLDELIPVG